MHRYEFHLRILPADYLDYYRGVARVVVATTRAGLRVQFPASLLLKFVTNGGIEGDFILTCDHNHKCVDLQRVEHRGRLA